MHRIKILLSGAFTCFLLICLTFVLSQWVPIDPTLSVIGDTASGDSYAQARTLLEVDLPVYKQLGNYFQKLFHGDFGISIMTANPVIQDLFLVFPATVELGIIALLIGIIGGVPIGILAAWRPNSLCSAFVRIHVIIYSIPTFVLAILALLVFYVQLGWTAGPGRVDILYSSYQGTSGFLLLDTALNGDWNIFYNALNHLILPASILGLFSMATLSRMTKSLMLEELAQPYIVCAQLKGLAPLTIVFKHAFRNIWLPLLTLIMMSFASLLEGAVIVETIFAWPGLGRYLTQSLMALDYNAFLGATLLVGIIFISCNVLVDLVSPKIDPRSAAA